MHIFVNLESADELVEEGNVSLFAGPGLARGEDTLGLVIGTSYNQLGTHPWV